MDFLTLLGSVVAASPPLLLATMGETLGEKAGIINLSLDGTLLLSAMTGFAVAQSSHSVALGFLAAALVGMAVSLILALVSLTLGQSQVACGFVLALLCRDLAYTLGAPFAHLPGPQVPALPVPLLESLPGIGPLLFQHDGVVYASLLLVIAVWLLFYRTQIGLCLRGLGENPQAMHSRGIAVVRFRYAVALLSGALVGLGGGAFSLLVKPGWARPYGIEGTGWIVLAIVIFGGWRPGRVALSALFFVTLQTLAGTLQSLLPDVPTQLFPSLPFPIMILLLLLASVGQADWFQRLLGISPAPLRRALQGLLGALASAPPAALGTRFHKD